MLRSFLTGWAESGQNNQTMCGQIPEKTVQLLGEKKIDGYCEASSYEGMRVSFHYLLSPHNERITNTPQKRKLSDGQVRSIKQ